MTAHKPQPALIPVVVQDAADSEVLMLAYADREALRRTVETGECWYFSRSRGRLWRKGETSGHTQKVVHASLDCDADAVLVRVEQTGPACHTGEKSCFHRVLDGMSIDGARFSGDGGSGGPSGADGLAFLGLLERIIEERDVTRRQGSYVSGLLEQGPLRVFQKLGEEAVEFVIAAAAAAAAKATAAASAAPLSNEQATLQDNLRDEAADLLFHFLVALRAAGLTLTGLAALLEARHRAQLAGGSPSAPGTSPHPGT
jgi:phosphoribosyl-ATP pyrophosphohydrolase/phosphoribosyl-AMP cyclohydrolase